jgi:hypothetical protein
MPEPRSKSPRLTDDAYLQWLRTQPCACGCRRHPCHAAHIRAGSPEYNKPSCTGLQIKPDDAWALPLYPSCHVDTPTSQHASGDELGWWKSRGVADVFALCLEHRARYLRDHPDAPSPTPYKKPKRRKPPKQPPLLTRWQPSKRKWPKRKMR